MHAVSYDFGVKKYVFIYIEERLRKTRQHATPREGVRRTGPFPLPSEAAVSQQQMTPLEGAKPYALTLEAAVSQQQMTPQEGAEPYALTSEAGVSQQLPDMRVRETEQRALASEERARAAEQRAFVSGEQAREAQQLAETRVREAEQRVLASEERARATQQHALALEERLRKAEQRALSSERRAREAEQCAQSSERRAREAEQHTQLSERRAREAEQHTQLSERRAREAEVRTEEKTRQAEQNAEERVRGADQRALASEERAVERHWVVERREIHITEEVLGGGGWGEVKMAEFRGTRVAAKSLYQAIMSDYYRQLFIREMNMAARVRHPNLVQFIGACMEGGMVILTELLPTSLRRELERGENHMTSHQLISIGLDVARALSYLHQMQPDPMIHRDISSANVLLEPLANQQWRAKVTDYGSVNFQQQLRTVGPGSTVYAAPEAGSPQLQSPKMDIFSFGVLLVEMWTASFPEVSAHERLIASIRDHECVGLIRRCTHQRPDRRSSAAEIIAELQERLEE